MNRQRDAVASCRMVPDQWLGPLALDHAFARAQPMDVDLGCGKGRFLLARAQHHPEVNFLGIDRMLRRIRKMDNKVRRLRLDNVRLIRVEGYYAVAYLLPTESVSTYYIFFPDPWPKKRHHDNRLFNPRFLDALHRTMKAGGRVHVATDHLPYFDIIQDVLARDARFTQVAPFEPSEVERTDFEMWYLGKSQIGRCSFEKKNS